MAAQRKLLSGRLTPAPPGMQGGPGASHAPAEMLLPGPGLRAGQKLAQERSLTGVMRAGRRHGLLR